jgi:3'-phosphoadenosine 5'-phosphosulfate sulfotransferase (PAPS reductase)/FAD synthetase
MQRIVMTSGGITSWAAARLLADRHGIEGMVLLFADTLVEDEDLYRFLSEASTDIGVSTTRVADGRKPWEVFRDRKWIGNTRTAHCAELLKQVPARRWLEANSDPRTDVIYLGIDWTETHRIPKIEAAYKPWRVEFPLTEPPHWDKVAWLAAANARGIRSPRLYDLGFAHNNCGGACVKGGQAQWARLLEVFPERFAANERAETQLRAELNTEATILRDRRGGTTKPLPLTALRQRVQGADACAVDRDDWGGCGCFVDMEAQRD